MTSAGIIVTANVDAVVREFLAAPQEPLWGYLIRQRTDLKAASVHEVLARIEQAGWVDRTDEQGPSGGRPRVTYRLNPDEVPSIRHELAVASLRRSRTAASKHALKAGRASTAPSRLRPEPGI